jgi:hypothetical protein
MWFRTSRKTRPARPGNWPSAWRRSFRPRLEVLEDRAVPAMIAWDGGPTGNGTDWLDATNWAGDVQPGAADDVTLGSTGGNPTIVLRTWPTSTSRIR